MAKNEPKTSPATDPTILPPMLVEVSPDDVATEPEIAAPPSTLPAGVVMHDTGVLPYTSNRADLVVADPSQPPAGWKGSFSRCGGCGDFLGNANRCEKCSPPMGPNVVNSGGAR